MLRLAVAVLLSAAAAVGAVDPAYYIRNTRRAIPQELYRDNVEPSKGGKVPEAAHMRIELNKLDAAGLESGEGVRMMEDLINADLSLPEKAGPVDTSGTSYNPGYSPPLKLKPDYVPEPAYDPYSPPEPAYEPYSPPSPAYSPDPYSPEPYSPPAPAYSPDPYSPPKPAYSPDPYVPEPYAPPKPAYQKPVGPVLLEKRPYEVKSVQPLPVTVAESYTGFDCRSVPYPDRHYADPEAGCEIYHFCHADGKQDTFHCGYGTIFNEYLGTCDYKNNVHCGAPYPAEPAPYPAEPAPHAPAYHAVSSPYHENPYHNFGPF